MKKSVAILLVIVTVLFVSVGVVGYFLLTRNLNNYVDNGFRVYAQSSLDSGLTSPHAQSAVAEVARMSLTDRIRSLFILGKPGTNGPQLRQFVEGAAAGGFILMGSNIPSTPEQLRALTSMLSTSPEFPRLIAIDEEGGDVKRLPYDTYPGANTLRSLPVADTETAFGQRGVLLSSVGVTWNFGIVADVTSNPSSFIYSRTFGNTGLSAAPRVTAAVKAESQSTVLSTLKHFPGHGAAPGDSHSSIPATSMSLADWKTSDSLPFDAGIKAGAASVMFGHLVYSSVDKQPATLSATWHKILREDFGFTGVAVTDDMLMLQHSSISEFADPYRNAIRALAAGNNALLYVLGENPASEGIDIDTLVTQIVAAVNEGEISQQQVNESAVRVMAARRSISPVAKNDTQACNIACTIGYSLLFPNSAHK